MLAANCSNVRTLPHTPVYSVETPNRVWLAALRSADRAQAMADLHRILLNGVCAGLGKRYGEALNRELDPILSAALAEIERCLDKGPGERRFTTWALKIAIHTGLRTLRGR